VAATHQQFAVTKRGRPVARLVPIEAAEPPSLLGSVLDQHDLVGPIDDRWDAER
jgi:antitoxin (DNA-binding transcriptional repressor) of toxin-antitoxin stability system